jgi:hypothetical protein
VVAVGCLLLIVLPLAGLLGGGFFFGPEGATWGAVIGFVVAVVACAVPAFALVKAGRHR